MDKHLKWNEHILNLTKNIRKLLRTFYILRQILCKKLLISVYKSLVESLIRYGIVVWGGLYQNSLNSLNVVQNYILKVLFEKNKLSSANLLCASDIFDVRSIYVFEVCCFVKKNNEINNYVMHSYNTRNCVSKHLVTPKIKTNLNKRSFTYLAPKIFNLIPNNIKSVHIFKTFKKLCKNFIFENNTKFKELFI